MEASEQAREMAATRQAPYWEDDDPPPRARPASSVRWNDLWTIERKPADPLPGTEALLNGLIDECGFLMREVAFRLVRSAPDVDMVAEHMNRAMALARTGAEVGLAVAKLRRASAVESRQSITLERVERLPEIEKPSIRANNDQDAAS